MDTVNEWMAAFGAFSGAIKLLILVGACSTIAFLAWLIRVSICKKLSIRALSAIEKKAPHFLRLKGIQLFPADSSADIQIVAYINTVKFVYPAADESGWMRTDSNMSEKTIELPSADMYYIRFEINFSSAIKLEGGPALVRGGSAINYSKKVSSQTTATLPITPLVHEYKLYLLQDGSRDMSVKAVIAYDIYAEQDSLLENIST